MSGCCNIYTVSEHDMDFLIMREIVSGGSLAAELMQAANIQGGEVVSVENSVWDNELGETDILVMLNVDNTKCALLIEDKINARHQPMQYARYLLRGQKGVKNSVWDRFEILLIAPEEYIAKESEAAKYPHKYTYEQLRSYFDDGGNPFDSLLIERALQKKETSYDLIENKAVTAFWKDYLSYKKEWHPDLACANKATAKGTYSSWVQYYVSMKKELILYHKLDKGYIDLQFTGVGGYEHELDKLLKEMDIDIKKEGLTFEETGNSISLRIIVAPVDITGSFEEVPIETKESWFFALERLSALVDRFDKEKMLEFIKRVDRKM